MTVVCGALRALWSEEQSSPHAARRFGRLHGVMHGLALRAMSLRDVRGSKPTVGIRGVSPMAGIPSPLCPWVDTHGWDPATAVEVH